MLLPTIEAPWSLEVADVLRQLKTSANGLSFEQAQERRRNDGKNELQQDAGPAAWRIFLRQFSSPLVLILLAASILSYLVGDHTETLMIVVLLLIGAILAFSQEYRSERALRQLRKTLSRQAWVIRRGKRFQLPAEELCRGDIVELNLGGIVPADLRLIDSQGLEIDEALITGESVPVQKTTASLPAHKRLPQDQINLAFEGTHVVQGAGRGVVTAIGGHTEVGRTAGLLTMRVDDTDFQKGIRSFGNFLLKLTIGLCVLVTLSLGLMRGQWADSLLFALALAVGISPELLPLIISITLSRGALAMSKKQVLVKRLIAIEDLGNADVFCTDKTGTLTVGALRVRNGMTADEKISKQPLAYALQCLATTDRAGAAPNAIDDAILTGGKTHRITAAFQGARRRQLLPFDFQRRRMGVVIQQPRSQQRWLIVKGATTEVLSLCHSAMIEDDDRGKSLSRRDHQNLQAMVNRYQDSGYRLIAVARRTIESKKSYSAADERDMELVGFVLASDAPKVSAKAALASLNQLHARIVILTGDHERVTQHVARQLGFTVAGALCGQDIETLSDKALAKAVETNNVFARITPAHKLRIIQALKRNGHTVGFMGDGVNDAPALRQADVGISFESAVDVAKEAADVILLKKKLSVLADGIREGRRTFINTQKYIHVAASTNFGSMLSLAGASLLLPFIPLLPAQILLNNLLSDAPMLFIAGDHVPDSELATPKKWDIRRISQRMYFFGLIMSLADYVTFAVLLLISHVNIGLFRTGWFVESLLAQIVVIFILRTKRLFSENRPSRGLVLAAAVVAAIAIMLPFSPLKDSLNFSPIPPNLIVTLAAIVIGYAIVAELSKRAVQHWQPDQA